MKRPKQEALAEQVIQGHSELRAKVVVGAREHPELSAVLEASEETAH